MVYTAHAVPNSGMTRVSTRQFDAPALDLRRPTMRGRRGSLLRRQYLLYGMIRPVDHRYASVLTLIGCRLYGLPGERAARIAADFVVHEMVTCEPPSHNYPLVLLRRDAVAFRNERGLPPLPSDDELTRSVAFASTLALLKPPYRRALRRFVQRAECCHTISPRFGWTREYFHEVFDRFHRRVVEAYHVLRGDTLDQVFEDLRRLRNPVYGSYRVTCVACGGERWLDPEPGHPLTCTCGSASLLIDGIPPAEWFRLITN
jgi:hypothetical protein